MNRSLLRRRIRRTLGLLVALVAVLASISTPATAAYHLRHAATTPRPGGTVTWNSNAGGSTPPGCLDPASAATDYNVSLQIGDTLVSLDDHKRLRPALATRWTVSHGGQWLTFYLRQGVRFSNGDPLDAAAVKFTLDRIRNPQTRSYLLPAFNVVQAVQVVDPSTVRLILAAPFRPILTNALANAGSSVVDPKAVQQEGDRFCQYPVTSGAFMVKSVGPGLSTITLVPNPYHTWGGLGVHNQGRAYLSTLVIKYLSSDATAVSALENGDVDISVVAGDQLARVRHNPAIVLHPTVRFNVTYLGFNTAHPPFDKLEVRRAIAEAIDRKALIKVALGGLGVPAYSPIPVTVPFHDARSQGYAVPYTPTEAQRILAANHVTGPYTLVTNPDPAQQTAVELIQSELAQVGVQTKIVLGDVTQRKGQFDLFLTRAGMTDPDALYVLFHSSQTVDKGGLNVTSYRSATLDTLLVQGRETLDPDKAGAIYARVQRYIDAHVVTDPLWTAITVVAVRTRVHGWHTGILPFTPLFQDLYVNG